MRRLPVFFVLDCSESMAGENLKKMEDGLQMIVRTLRKDPHALENAYISVIAFAGVSKTIAPLVDVASFYPPKLPLGGGTSLGEALHALMAEIDKSVVKTTPDRKGDWKPIIYLFTDGRPTDKPDAAIEQWNSKYARKATLIAIGLGQAADFSALRKLTEHVIVFNDSQDGDFTKFIAWVTDSVSSHSKSVGEGQETQVFPKLDTSVMKLVKEAPSTLADEVCVTLIGRCQKTRRPYIMKYERAMQKVETRDFKVNVAHYDITGCYPLDEEYFAWSDPRATNIKINSDELIGTPGCPHCGNPSAFGVCACGKLLCFKGPGEITCPWCEKTGFFGPVPSGAEGGFDVGRGRG